MLCPTCNNFRPVNDAPCPWCSAPAGAAQGAQQEPASYGLPRGGAPMPGPFATDAWDGASAGIQQLAFSAGEQAAGGEQAFWTQTAGAREQSLLPVPYQAPGQPPPHSLVPLPTTFPTHGPHVRAVNSLVPVQPDQEMPVYVPPMYTKPRPIIPRYRAVSGLISVIVVVLLLCAGGTYLAQVTGKLTPLEKFLGFYAPPSIASTARTLPVPSAQQTPGAGNKVITSIGLGNSVDPQSHLIPIYANQFTAGQTIYLTCSINASKPGTIITKWYTNNNMYREFDRFVTDPKTQNQGLFQMVYNQPAEGKVEVYWRDQQGQQQLAATLLFVVEPIAQ
jgi:hypothetical protein